MKFVSVPTKIRHYQQERGQGLVEYALLIVLIAVVVIAVLSLLGPRINSVFEEIIFTMSTDTRFTYTWSKPFNVHPNNTDDCEIFISNNGLGVRATDAQGNPAANTTIAVRIVLENGIGKTFTGSTDTSGNIIWSNQLIGVDPACGDNNRTATAKIGSLEANATY